jgi:hypothetical protein
MSCRRLVGACITASMEAFKTGRQDTRGRVCRQYGSQRHCAQGERAAGPPQPAAGPLHNTAALPMASTDRLHSCAGCKQASQALPSCPHAAHETPPMRKSTKKFFSTFAGLPVAMVAAGAAQVACKERGTKKPRTRSPVPGLSRWRAGKSPDLAGRVFLGQRRQRAGCKARPVVAKQRAGLGLGMAESPFAGRALEGGSGAVVVLENGRVSQSRLCKCSR